MTWLEAVILGVVEGVTEFLPISSTGHLILTTRLLGMEATEFVKSFEVAIQLGAVLAVVTRYGRLLTNLRMVRVLAVGFAPTAVVGLLLYPFIKSHLLGSTAVVLWALAIGGLVIIVFERWLAGRIKARYDLNSVTYGQALIIGCCQAVAVVPGVSRAAATVVGGLSVGLSRRATVEFSFLLAIPTMLAATGFDLWKTASNFSAGESWLLLAGGATAFVVAHLTVRWLLRWVESHSFTWFGVYRLALAFIGWLVLV